MWQTKWFIDMNYFQILWQVHDERRFSVINILCQLCSMLKRRGFHFCTLFCHYKIVLLLKFYFFFFFFLVNSIVWIKVPFSVYNVDYLSLKSISFSISFFLHLSLHLALAVFMLTLLFESTHLQYITLLDFH